MRDADWALLALLLVLVLAALLVARAGGLPLVARAVRGGLARLRGGAARTRGSEMRRVTAQDIRRALEQPHWPRPAENRTRTYAYEAELRDGRLHYVADADSAGPYAGPLYVFLAQSNRYTHDSFLTPYNVRATLDYTRRGLYAWCLFDDTPDADDRPRRVALRLAPGRPLPSQEELRQALRARVLSPSRHKVTLRDFASMLESFGVEVVYSGNAEGVMRFSRAALIDYATRHAEFLRMTSMTREKVLALDWSEVDAKLRPLVAQGAEYAGHIELEGERLRVVSCRKFGAGSAMVYPRAAVLYHTHPRRPTFLSAEIPSDFDMLFSLNVSFDDSVCWSIVVAPEGEYVTMVSEALLELYYRDRAAAEELVAQAHRRAWDECESASWEDIAEGFGDRVRSCGITVILRRNPAHTMGSERFPANSVDLDALAAKVAGAAALEPARLLRADAHRLVEQLFLFPRSFYYPSSVNWWYASAALDGDALALDPDYGFGAAASRYFIVTTPAPVIVLYGRSESAPLPPYLARAAAKAMRLGRAAWLCVARGPAARVELVARLRGGAAGDTSADALDDEKYKLEDDFEAWYAKGAPKKR